MDCEAHNLAEVIARTLISDKTAVFPLTGVNRKGEEVTWKIRRSSKYDNVVTLSCSNGASCEFDFTDETDLADGICDILSEQ